MKREIECCLFCKTRKKTHRFKFNILDLNVASSTLNCVYPHPTFFICEKCMEDLPREINELRSRYNAEMVGDTKLIKLVPKVRKLGIQQNESTYVGDVYQQIANVASAKKPIDAMNALVNIIVMTIDLVEIEHIEYIHYEHNFNLNKEFNYFVRTISEMLVHNRYASIISYCIFAIRSLGYEPFKCLDNYVTKISKLKGEKR